MVISESRAVFAALYIVGLSGMAPAVTFGDAGEFIAAAATLSVPHSPGYPLFCLLAKAFGTLFPVGSWAFRVNLFSVVCGAAAGAVFLDGLKHAGLSRPARLFAVGALCLSGPWLHNTLQTEVFALNNLIAASCLWVAAAYRDRLFDPRPAAAFGFILGLGGGNHHTLILILPPVIFAGWLARSKPDRVWRAAGWFLGFGLLGLSVYAYLPIRAALGPPLNWGNPVDLPRFLHVLLRRDYGSFALTVEGASGGRLVGIALQLLRFASETWRGLGFAASAAILAGFYFSRWRRDALPLGVMLLAGPGFLALGNPPFDPVTTGALERFYLLPWFGAVWIAGIAVHALSERSPRAAYALLAVPVLGAVMHSGAWAQRWDLAAHDYGRNILRSLPKNSVLFIDGGDDTFYTLANLLFAERRRSDLQPHDRGGLVFSSAYGPDFRQLPKPEKEPRRVAVETAMADAGRPVFYATLNRNVIPNRALPLHGLLRRLGPAAPHQAFETEDNQGVALWRIYPRRFSRIRGESYYRYRALVPFYSIMQARAAGARGNYKKVLQHLLDGMVLAGDAMWTRTTLAGIAEWTGFQASQAEQWETAAAAYRTAAAALPGRADPWVNLGVALERQGKRGEAAAAYGKAVEVSPDSFQAHYNFGAFLWKDARWKEARASFERASALRPSDKSARHFAQQAAARE